MSGLDNLAQARPFIFIVPLIVIEFFQRLIRAETRWVCNQSLKRVDVEVVKLGQAALK